MHPMRLDKMLRMIEDKYPAIDEDCEVVMDIMYQWGFMSAPRLQLHTGFDIKRAKYSLIYLTLCGDLKKGSDGVTYSLNRE